jgi:hypothetical protein
VDGRSAARVGAKNGVYRLACILYILAICTSASMSVLPCNRVGLSLRQCAAERDGQGAGRGGRHGDDLAGRWACGGGGSYPGSGARLKLKLGSYAQRCGVLVLVWRCTGLARCTHAVPFRPRLGSVLLRSDGGGCARGAAGRTAHAVSKGWAVPGAAAQRGMGSGQRAGGPATTSGLVRGKVNMGLIGSSMESSLVRKLQAFAWVSYLRPLVPSGGVLASAARHRGLHEEHSRRRVQVRAQRNSGGRELVRLL